MIGRAVTLVALCALTACDSAVHVRLSAGDDEMKDQQCAAAVVAMRSFYAELERQERVFRLCVDLPRGDGQARSLAELELLLSSRIIFDGVPQTGGWTVWVEGYTSRKCGAENAGAPKEAPILCGKASPVTITQPGDEITVLVFCAPDSIWPAEILTEICRSRH